MATRTTRIFVFALLPVLVLTVVMRCGPESEDIPELHGVKALIAVVPQKDIYQVGDTIALSIKAEKSKWNNWVYFEKAFFGPHALVVGGTVEDNSIVALYDMAQHATKASFVDGDWMVEQMEFYVLKQAKTYIFDYSKKRPVVGSYYGGDGNWHVSYTEGNTYYSTLVPMYTEDGKQYLEVKVE